MTDSKYLGENTKEKKKNDYIVDECLMVYIFLGFYAIQVKFTLDCTVFINKFNLFENTLILFKFGIFYYNSL